MASIVRSGAWDLIGAARPSIADPFLPQKIADGRTDEIRECTGSNVCIMKVDGFGHLGCIQNATAGEEHRRGWHPERFSVAANAEKGVLVVGAGPAGMECAVTLGRRGFEAVHLVEASDEIGGRMRWVRRLPTLGDWGRIVDHRKVMLSKLRNVEVVTGRPLSADDVRDYGAQIVIVATGSRWSGEGLQSSTHEPIDGASATLPHVLTPEQVMDGKRPAGRRVVVYDAEGYFVGPGIAELLAGDGLEVRPRHVARRRFADLRPDAGGARCSASTCTRRASRCTGVSPSSRSSRDWCRGRTSSRNRGRLETDGVVLVTQQVSDDALYRELVGDPAALDAGGIESVYRIGDCAAPRMISEAIFDGHRMAREIDGPDPAVALAFDRERNVPDIDPVATR